MTEMNQAVMNTGETNMQLIARMLKQYGDMFKHTHPMMAAEMKWLSDVATGEHAHCAELHRVLEIERCKAASMALRNNAAVNVVTAGIYNMIEAYETTKKESHARGVELDPVSAFAAGVLFMQERITK